MPKTKVVVSNSDRTQPMRPALTPEARENQMIALAVDLAEQQLRDGTASSQVITHFLKLATVKEQLEREKLTTENKLLQAKIKDLESQASSAALYSEALKAFSVYSGQAPAPQEEDEEDEY